MIKIKDIFFEQTERFDDFLPPNEIYFVINITLILGDKDKSSFFYFDLTNDYDESSDRKILEDVEVYFRKKGLFIINVFDKTILLKFLQEFILNKNIEDLVEYFYWEFDDYIP